MTAALGEAGALTGERGGMEGAYGYVLRENCCRACKYLSVNRVPCTFMELVITMESRRKANYPFK